MTNEYVGAVYAKVRNGERPWASNKSPITFQTSAIEFPARASGMGGCHDDVAFAFILYKQFPQSPESDEIIHNPASTLS